MRFFLRSFLVFALIAGMAGLPTMAAGDKPLGMVVASQAGYLDRTQAATGVDVYSGDVLSTDPGGTLRLKVKATQLYLLSASAATLAKTDTVLHAHLSSGIIGFSTVPDDHLEIETPIATVRPANGQRAFGQVTIAGPDTILVAAYRGSLIVNGHGEERTIKEGEAYNVRLAQDAAPVPQDAGAPPHQAYHTAEHLIFTLVFLGVAGTASYLIYHYEAESDSVPAPATH